MAFFDNKRRENIFEWVFRSKIWNANERLLWISQYIKRINHYHLQIRPIKLRHFNIAQGHIYWEIERRNPFVEYIIDGHVERLHNHHGTQHSNILPAFSKLLPSKVASKKLAPTKFELRKSVSLTMLCWNATPFKLRLLKSLLSRFTPRVMEMVRPLWRVDAPPVVIFELEKELAPWSAAWATLGRGERIGAVRRVSERRAVAAAPAWLDDACRAIYERVCLDEAGREMFDGRKAETCSMPRRQPTNKNEMHVLSAMVSVARARESLNSFL